MKRFPWSALAVLLFSPVCFGGNELEVSVHFDKKIRLWDGFGVNYVETAQTRDYRKQPQEYGGFSTLSEQKRAEILDLLFGPDGLKPGLLKMFLDPFHEGMTIEGNDNSDPRNLDQSRFDHETTTKWMRLFAKEGLRRQRARGADLEIITTLYGPPAWTTKQKFLRGRDIDPNQMEEIAEYIAAWVKYLRDVEKLPIRYASIHNEGDSFARWPTDGSWAGYPKHDYNAYWHSSLVAKFLPILRAIFDGNGLQAVDVTPGETSSWDRFIHYGYAFALADDPRVLASMGLITSHGFGGPAQNTPMGVDYLRLRRPELHAWTTSMTWGKMDASFLELIRQQIYEVGVNGVIPWATIQTSDWYGGDPNPGTAIRVDGRGGYSVEPGYYYFKPVSRAGQPGMAVAEVLSTDPDIRLMAFAANGTIHPDAFVVVNSGARHRDLRIRLTGSKADTFRVYTTGPGDRYRALGDHALRQGRLEITAPADSVLGFFAGR
ncbi:MAG: hypothetical protein R2762_28020 [Bryobacteraceae bacterium]